MASIRSVQAGTNKGLFVVVVVAVVFGVIFCVVCCVVVFVVVAVAALVFVVNSFVFLPT